jgi:hypothetical protein
VDVTLAVGGHPLSVWPGGPDRGDAGVQSEIDDRDGPMTGAAIDWLIVRGVRHVPLTTRARRSYARSSERACLGQAGRVGWQMRQTLSRVRFRRSGHTRTLPLQHFPAPPRRPGWGSARCARFLWPRHHDCAAGLHLPAEVEHAVHRTVTSSDKHGIGPHQAVAAIRTASPGLPAAEYRTGRARRRRRGLPGN